MTVEEIKELRLICDEQIKQNNTKIAVDFKQKLDVLENKITTLVNVLNEVAKPFNIQIEL